MEFMLREKKISMHCIFRVPISVSGLRAPVTAFGFMHVGYFLPCT